MTGVNIDTSQLKILEDFFNDLSLVDQRRIFMRAFRKGAKPLIQAARTNIPSRTGRLRRSLGTVEVSNEIAIIAGTKLGGVNKGWYGHIVEYGTVLRKTKKGYNRGIMPANNFFERSYNATEDTIMDGIREEWYNEIDRFIIRVNSRLK
jgi:HK97 gp10 family phage protein